jgi:hypothetical protein
LGIFSHVAEQYTKNIHRSISWKKITVHKK